MASKQKATSRKAAPKKKAPAKKPAAKKPSQAQQIAALQAGLGALGVALDRFVEAIKPTLHSEALDEAADLQAALAKLSGD